MPDPQTGLDRWLHDAREYLGQQRPASDVSPLEQVLGPYSGSPLFYDPRIGMFYLNERASSPEHYRILQHHREMQDAGHPFNTLGAGHAAAFPDIWNDDDPFELLGTYANDQRELEEMRKELEGGTRRR